MIQLADILWQPVTSPILLVVSGVVLCLLAVFAYVRSQRGGQVMRLVLLLLRLGLIVLLIVILFGPSEIPESREKLITPTLTILLDTSASMQTEDVDGQSRISAATRYWFNEETLRTLSEHYHVKFRQFAQARQPLSLEMLRDDAGKVAEGGLSNITNLITDEILETSSGKGDEILVISDGHDTSDAPFQPTAQLGKARRIPIHTVIVGEQSFDKDMGLIAFTMQPYLMVEEQGEIYVRIYQKGLEQGQTALSVKDESGSVSRYPIQFKGRKQVTLNIPVKHSDSGQFRYELSLDALDDEKVTENNKQDVFVNVTDKKLAVLLIEGQPHWDTKFLSQALRKDSRIEYTQISYLSSSRPLEVITTAADKQTVVIPTEVQGYRGYDIVILGSGLERMMNLQQANALVTYVTEGNGQLIFARSRPYDIDVPEGKRLAKVLSTVEPVVWEQGIIRDGTLKLTALGRTNPPMNLSQFGIQPDQLIAQLPSFHFAQNIQQAKNGTQVLANLESTNGETQPAVVSMNVGNGSVFGILGEGLYQWSLLPPGLNRFDGVYDSVWSGVVRSLTMQSGFKPGQDVSLNLSQSNLRLGEQIEFSIALRHDPPSGSAPSLTVTPPSEQAASIPLQYMHGTKTRMQGSFEPAENGVYTVTLNTPGMEPGTITQYFSVIEDNVELLDTSANPQGMMTLAKASGGEVIPYNQIDTFINKVQTKRILEKADLEPLWLWDRSIFLIVLMVAVGIEWIGRRIAGMS